MSCKIEPYLHTALSINLRKFEINCDSSHAIYYTSSQEVNRTKLRPTVNFNNFERRLMFMDSNSL